MISADVAALAVPAHALVAPPASVRSLSASLSASGRVWRTITVRPGDTIWDLAITHRTTPQALVTKNRLPAGGSVIHPGQRLLVPGAAAAASPTAAARPAPSRRTHVVRPGETLSGIAATHRISLTKLLAANRLPDPRLIYVGQRIALPGNPRTSTPKASTKPTPTSANTFAGWTYSDATVQAASRNRAILAGRTVPNRAQTAAIIRQTAIRHGVDPKLALAVSWQESGWHQRAVSVANAVGVMQVIPSSGEWASALAGRRLDLLDTRDNITAGVVILRALRSAADSREQAIAGYYQGLRSVRTNGLYADSKLYVKAVLAHYKRM